MTELIDLQEIKLIKKLKDLILGISSYVPSL